MKPSNWNDAANMHLRGLMEHAATMHMDKTALDPIQNYLSAWILRLQEGDWDKADTDLSVQIIQQAGIYAMREMTAEGMPFDMKEMVDLLVRKQHDYGHDNINNFGVIGIAIRSCDKIARIKNLKENGADAKNEPFLDSYVDLIGYAVIAGMYHDGTFQLELKGETHE